jgi:hypothetical protein
MAGLLNLQEQLKQQGMAGLDSGVSREKKMKSHNNALESAADAAKKASMTTGLGVGVSAGIAAGVGGTAATATATAGAASLAGVAMTGGIGLALGYLAYEYL